MESRSSNWLDRAINSSSGRRDNECSLKSTIPHFFFELEGYIKPEKKTKLRTNAFSCWDGACIPIVRGNLAGVWRHISSEGVVRCTEVMGYKECKPSRLILLYRHSASK